MKLNITNYGCMSGFLKTDVGRSLSSGIKAHWRHVVEGLFPIGDFQFVCGCNAIVRKQSVT